MKSSKICYIFPMLFIAENEFSLLPKSTTKQEAINYYTKNVVGKTDNCRGKPVFIGQQEQNFMFKSKNIRKGEFSLHRGRRLPWIRPTIENTKTIKLEQRRGSYRELYLAKIGVYKPLLGIWIPQPTYFCVVVGGAECNERFFITAYPIGNEKFFLSKMALDDAY